jgi:uncharacterized membrane protein
MWRGAAHPAQPTQHFIIIIIIIIITIIIIIIIIIISGGYTEFHRTMFELFAEIAEVKLSRRAELFEHIKKTVNTTRHNVP